MDYRDWEGDAVVEAVFQGWREKAELLIRKGCDLGGGE